MGGAKDVVKLISDSRDGGDNHPDYPGKITKYLWLTAISAAAGGLIFGYDFAVWSGITSIDSFLKPFLASQDAELDFFMGTILTSLTPFFLVAAIFGCIYASKLNRRYGRRNIIFASGIVLLVGAILSAASMHVSMLILARMLVGIGVGFAYQTLPLYLSEIGPAKHHSVCNILFQILITVGIFVGELVNFATNHIPRGWGWRLSLGLGAIPAIFIVVSSCSLSDTPSSLLERGKIIEAKEELKRVRGIKNVDLELNDMLVACNASKHAVKRRGGVLFYSSLIPFIQHLTGVNVLIMYAPRLFRAAGFGANSSLMSAAIVCLVNVAATFVCVYDTARWPRRPLFLIGGVVMIAVQVTVAHILYPIVGCSSEGVANLYSRFAIFFVICICVLVAAFAFSWGTLGWLFLTEIYPLESRSVAQSITVTANMICILYSASLYVPQLCSHRPYNFATSAIFTTLATLFAFIAIPETKNVPVEEMPRIFRDHWKKLAIKLMELMDNNSKNVEEKQRNIPRCEA